MHYRTSIAAVLMAGSFAYGQAGVSVFWVPGYQLPMPKYFTCTNARASGEAQVYQPPTGGTLIPTFVEADLFVGMGILEYHVRHWSRNGEEASYPHIALSAMFDSSAFPSTAIITVRFRAIDNYDREYQSSNSAPNKNFQFCFAAPDFWYWPCDGQTVAHDTLMQMGYWSGGVQEGAWTNSDFANCLRVPVIYFNGHSTPGLLQAGNYPANELENVDEYVIYATSNGPGSVDVATSRSFWNGTGLPPFNHEVALFPQFGSNPPINLTFLESCCAGGDDQFATFLSPYTNSFVNPSLENQAVHAYSVFTRAIDSRDMANVLFGYLAEGFTINVASLALLTTPGVSCRDSTGGEWRPMNQITDRIIIGDPFTRLSTVYDPTTNNPLGFSRPL